MEGLHVGAVVMGVWVVLWWFTHPDHLILVLRWLGVVQTVQGLRASARWIAGVVIGLLKRLRTPIPEGADAWNDFIDDGGMLLPPGTLNARVVVEGKGILFRILLVWAHPDSEVHNTLATIYLPKGLDVQKLDGLSAKLSATVMEAMNAMDRAEYPDERVQKFFKQATFKTGMVYARATITEPELNSDGSIQVLLKDCFATRGPASRRRPRGLGA